MGLLRVLLALSVFMAHAPQSGLTYGLVGFGGINSVEIFFIISGIYIALILDKTYSSKWSFYKNRILRLYPIYYIICGLVLLRAFILPTFSESLFNFPAKAIAVGTLANSTFFGSDWLMFLQWENNNLHFGNFTFSEIPLPNMLFVPQSWSIGLEVTFYLLTPLICKAKSRTIFVLGFILLVARVSGLIFGLNSDPWTYRFFPFELPLFLLGILIYRIHNHKRKSFEISLNKIYPLLFGFYLIFPYFTHKLGVNRLWQMLILITLTSIIMVFGQEKSRDKKFGELSYPIYMSHVLILTTYGGLIDILAKRIPLLKNLNIPLFAIPLTLVITFVFSFLLLYLVKPVEKIRAQNKSRIQT